VGIAGGDFQGAVGAVGNRSAVFHGFHGPGFSTALGLVVCQRVAIAVIAAHHVRSVTDRDCPIQVLVDGHRGAGQAVASAALLDLPPAVSDRHRVVFADDAFRLHREDPVQMAPRAGPVRGAPFGSRLRKTGR